MRSHEPHANEHPLRLDLTTTDARSQRDMSAFHQDETSESQLIAR
jgi:hypothetical protein